MSEETTNQSTSAAPASAPVPPAQQPAPQPVVAPQPAAQAAPQPQPAAYAAPATPPRPAPQPQPMYAAPAAPPILTQLSGGMKFAWLAIGFLMGIPGMVLAWVVNVDKYPQVKSDAVKFSIIGFVLNIALVILFSIMFFGMMAAALNGIGSSYSRYY